MTEAIAVGVVVAFAVIVYVIVKRTKGKNLAPNGSSGTGGSKDPGNQVEP